MRVGDTPAMGGGVLNWLGGTAQNMYTGENQDTMPWVNWGNDDSPPCPPGWLYKGSPIPSIRHPIADWPPWSTWWVDKLKTGVYWQYIQNPNAFMCPVFAAQVVGTQGGAPGVPNWESYPNKLSSFCMNGASAFFPPFGQNNIYQYRTCKTSQIWSPLCIILWEPSGTSGSGNGYNDGANYPEINEGVSSLHVTGANVLTVGGSARVMSFADFLAEMNNPVLGDVSHGKGLLWWNPITPDGRRNY